MNTLELQALIKKELSVFNTGNNSFNIDVRDNYNTVITNMKNYDHNGYLVNSDIIILRHFDNSYHFIDIRSENDIYFEYTKKPTKLIISNCYDIEKIIVSNSLGSMLVVYKDYENKRNIKIFKFNFPCFLGKCCILDSLINIDDRLKLSDIKYNITEDVVELKFDMVNPYLDTIIINVNIFNKADNKPYLELEYIYDT